MDLMLILWFFWGQFCKPDWYPISMFSAILDVLIDVETCFEKNSILWMFNKKVEFNCCSGSALGLVQSCGAVVGAGLGPSHWGRCGLMGGPAATRSGRGRASDFLSSVFLPYALSAAAGGLFIDFMLQGQISIFLPEWILWEGLPPSIPLLGRCSARESCPFSL